MDPLFEPFSHVSRVEVPQHVFADLQRSIDQRRQKQRRWLGAVAAIAILIWGTQVYTMVDHFNQVDTTYTSNSSEADLDQYYSFDNQLYDYE